MTGRGDRAAGGGGTGTPAPRRRAPAAVRRRQILDAARHLFAERGFDATSTRDLSAAAEVNDGLLYRHFANKEAILRALRDEALEVFSTLPPIDAGEDLAGLLERVGGAFLAKAEANVDLLVLLIAEHRHRGEDHRYVTFVDRAARGLGALIDNEDRERGYLLARSYIGSLVAFVILQDILGLEDIRTVDRAVLVRHLAHQMALPSGG